MDKLDAAMELLQKAYKFAVEDGGDSNYELSHILFEMSEICRVEGEYDQALEYMFRVLELEQKQYGIFHPNAAVAQAAISLILLENGVSDKALYYCLMAMDTFKKAYGEQHTEMAFCYHLLGNLYESRGDYGMSMEN
jgi:tetratricopeptide (TPR) repeat protein